MDFGLFAFTFAVISTAVGVAAFYYMRSKFEKAISQADYYKEAYVVAYEENARLRKSLQHQIDTDSDIDDIINKL